MYGRILKTPFFQLAFRNLLKPSWYLPKATYTHRLHKIQSNSAIHLECSFRTLIIRNFHDDYIMADNKYAADYDKRGQASCKKCKAKIGKEALRLAKVTANPFSEDAGEMKQYYHPACMFETFIKARATTKIIDDTDAIQEFEDLKEADQQQIIKLIDETLEKKKTPKKGNKTTPKKVTAQATLSASPTKTLALGSPSTSKAPGKEKESPSSLPKGDPTHKDNSFRCFRRLCADVAAESSYTGKSKIVSTFLTKGSTGDGFQGDTYLFLKLLLPGVVKTVYYLNNKQLVKIFSQIFRADLADMQEDLNQGDVAETVRIFFEDSTYFKPAEKSNLTIHQVNDALEDLAGLTREEDQQQALTRIARKCTSNELKMIVRLIKHDLRINAGAKHILEALDHNAYDAFQASRSLQDVVARVQKLRDAAKGEDGKPPGLSKKLSVRASLMTPVLPMLAEACKSVEQAFKRCPNGMYSEIKYDGERVQVHKQGESFNYYSRSLKPVLPHKVSHFKEWIPKAFPDASDLILDGEVLLIDTNTGKPLPFGTLGVHKKSKFQDANVCLFIFDCLHYNGENLMLQPIKKRREYLYKVMKEIPNRIMFSEMNHITEAGDLRSMMARVFNEGLEGLVLKDVNSVYEPGKRHWLKVKKDYLADGAMADSADLIVLGAYYGTGTKGGLMSIFLMGCYDPGSRQFVTVTKCGNGFDDDTLEKLQKQLEPKMVKISKDYGKIPSWLNIKKGNLVPDFVAKDPKQSPVWEISGAEFSASDGHTAGGISIRFPRCTKMRDDKDWSEATDLPRLKELVKISKERSDFGEMLGASPSKKKRGSSSEDDRKKTPSKRKVSDSDDAGETPSKRRKGKPLCKYGEKCYQKNEQHLRDFSHDFSKAEDIVPGPKSKKLPNVFTGLKFLIDFHVQNRKKMERYIIAYDGDVVTDYEQNTATHHIYEKEEEGKKTAGKGVVSTLSGWVWSCIKDKTLHPVPSS